MFLQEEIKLGFILKAQKCLYQVGGVHHTVCEAQKRQLKQPQTPILFWPPNNLAMVVKS